MGTEAKVEGEKLQQCVLSDLITVGVETPTRASGGCNRRLCPADSGGEADGPGGGVP